MTKHTFVVGRRRMRVTADFKAFGDIAMTADAEGGATFDQQAGVPGRMGLVTYQARAGRRGRMRKFPLLEQFALVAAPAQRPVGVVAQYVALVAAVGVVALRAVALSHRPMDVRPLGLRVALHAQLLFGSLQRERMATLGWAVARVALSQGGRGMQELACPDRRVAVRGHAVRGLCTGSRVPGGANQAQHEHKRCRTGTDAHAQRLLVISCIVAASMHSHL